MDRRFVFESGYASQLGNKDVIRLITGIAHVAYAVSDLDRTLDFYCRGLGLREAFRLYDDNGQTRIVYVQVRDLDFIEFFPRRPGMPSGTEARPGAASFRHLSLAVDDMQATVRELAARGIHTEKEPIRGKDLNWQSWIVDPDGNRIELMQIAADSPQNKAALEASAIR